jgi:hypothetical protein
MVVSGSVERPLLGMLHRDGTPEDLTDSALSRKVCARLCRAQAVYRPRRANAL